MNIRNFCIIAHIDHGKSTLADRLLEVTGTVEARRMRPQYLDQLELERERGITIKMAPVRMQYSFGGKSYVLNLIDTPGHSDFSYEVSRALLAVEGAILLVDATKGIQAQTLSNLRAAERAGLAIVGAVNKIDLDPRRAEEAVRALADLLKVPSSDIFRISAKTGEGVSELLRAVVLRVPPPRAEQESRALIFDSLYDEHKGILAYVRVFGGEFKGQARVLLGQAGARVALKEVGEFAPELRAREALRAGEIGYLATGLKDPGVVRIGDTVSDSSDVTPLPGFRVPQPVVFISFYPEGETEFDDLKAAFAKLHLSDPALTFEQESNEALGRGLKAGFLGQLHFEIVASRIRDEFGAEFFTSFPSVAFRVTHEGREEVITQPRDFPEKPDRVFQPIIHVEIHVPKEHVNAVMGLSHVFDLEVSDMKNIGDHILLSGTMPLAELLRDFDDRLKSATSGFASYGYELQGEAEADVAKLEVLVHGEVVHALTRIVPKKDLEREARSTVEKLKEHLPRAQIAQALQAKAMGRIIARETIPALRKDVTGYLYGGDRSRKMKLWKKQARGKERLQETTKISVPLEVFRKILEK